MRGMRDSAKDAQVDVLMQGYGTVFGVFFTNLPAISNYREQAKGASYALAQGFSRQMFERGVFQEPHIRWLNTTAHTEEDIEKTVTASYESFKEVRKMEKQP